MTGKRYVPIFALALTAISACAIFRETPPVVRPFQADPSYTEHIADPGTVDLACIGVKHHDDGFRTSWNDSFCGCTKFDVREVWIARHISCDRERTEKHEACHVRTGPSKKARAQCEKDFPLPNQVHEIPRSR
jgi:hypothetical protein